MRRSTRLRTRLVLIALVISVPALGLLVYEQSVERRRSRQHAVEDIARVARLTASEEGELLDGVRRFLLTLAEFPGLKQDSPAACAELLPRLFRENPRYVSIWVVNADSSGFCGVKQTPITSSTIRSRTWFRRALEARTTVLGDFQMSTVTGTPDVVVAQPVLDDQGQVKRIVAVGIALEHLDAITAKARIPPGATLTLTDPDQKILARFPVEPNLAGKLQPDRLAASAIAASDGVVEAVGADGRQRLYAIVPVNGGLDSGLTVTMAIEPAAVFAEANQLLRQHLMLLALVSLAAVTVALVGGQVFILGPVAAIGALTHRIADGDLGARTELRARTPALGDLGEAVNTLTAALANRERTLRESEQRFRQITETIAEVFWVADSTISEMIYVSPAYEQIWGRSCASLYQHPKSFLEAVHPDDRSRVMATLARKSSGQPFDHEYRIIRPDGEIRWIWDRGFPVPNSQGPALRYVGAAQDITLRRNAEDAIREADERTRFALETSNVGIWEANLTTGVSFWSEVCERMHGVAPETFGRTYEAFLNAVHPDDRQRVGDTIEAAVSSRSAARFDYRTIWPDGTTRQIQCTAHFIFDEEGRPCRGIGFVTDVTEQRSLEEQLRQAQKMEAVGQLAGGIAHDFNNMLTAIIGNAELLLHDLPDSARQRRELQEVVKSAERAATLTQQLLAFSRKQVLAPRVLRVSDVVSGVTPMLRRLVRSSIDLRISLSEQGHVKADAGQIEQVLMNLAVNARDAMKQGGLLTIETSDVILDEASARAYPALQPGPHVVIAVSDTGHGMDAATQKHAFEPFFTTKPQGEGTGLGLATVYGIVKQSGGHIFLHSEVNKGTTFKVFLRRSDEPLSAPPDSVPAARPRAGHETILYVEDEEAVREFVHKILVRQGYHVHVVGDATGAFEFAQRHRGPIDLIFADVVLPGMSGPALASELRQQHPESRVLFASGYTDKAIVHDGVLDADTAFLQKPFRADVLVTRVREVLDAPG
jgi:PAS domain S-box-containing protein